MSGIPDKQSFAFSIHRSLPYTFTNHQLNPSDFIYTVHVHLPGFQFPLPPVKEPWATTGIHPPQVSFIRQQRRGGHIRSTVSPFILSLLAFCTGSHLKHTHTHSTLRAACSLPDSTSAGNTLYNQTYRTLKIQHNTKHTD